MSRGMKKYGALPGTRLLGPTAESGLLWDPLEAERQVPRMKRVRTGEDGLGLRSADTR